MRMLISVTREDIYGATRRSPEFCPIARALNRRFPAKRIPCTIALQSNQIVFDSQVASIAVMPDWASFPLPLRGPDLSLRHFKVRLPQAAFTFLRKFDHPEIYRTPAPFTFEIEIPEALALLAPLALALPPAAPAMDHLGHTLSARDIP